MLHRVTFDGLLCSVHSGIRDAINDAVRGGGAAYIQRPNGEIVRIQGVRRDARQIQYQPAGRANWETLQPGVALCWTQQAAVRPLAPAQIGAGA